MLTRMIYIFVIFLALPVWVLGLCVPVAWLIGAAAVQFFNPAPAAGLTFAWQLKLYSSSLLLMTLSTLVAMTLAALATYAFACVSRLAMIWITAAVLVVPPLVYGYLWLLTLGNRVLLQSLPVPFNLPMPNLGNLALASWAIGLWLWPIPALILTTGWQWTGRPAWLLARMDTSDRKAFTRAALPAMRAYLLAAGAICMLLAAQEYAVPALFSVQTWQTQWLELARAGIPLGRLAQAALPPALLLLGLIWAFARFCRTVESTGHTELGTPILCRRVRLFAWTILLAIISLTTVIPGVGAVRSLTRGIHFNAQRFHDELINTPIIMASVATLAVAAAIFCLPIQMRRKTVFKSMRPYSRAFTPVNGCPCRLQSLSWIVLTPSTLLILSIAAWSLPISLMAESGKQAQTAALVAMDHLGRQIPLISVMLSRSDVNRGLDIWLWVSVLAGRMLPVAWLLIALLAHSLPAHLVEQAQVDGASAPQILRRILLPLLTPAAAAGWLICALLVATDSVAATMLQPAGFQVLSVSLLNQMHYGKDGDIVATCLMTLAAAALTAAAAAMAFGKSRRTDGE